MQDVYISRLFHDAGTVELCHMDHGRIWATWHSKPETLLIAASQAGKTGNLFTTLNRIDIGRLNAHLAGQGATMARTPDSAITRYCRLFFDFDPARPKGTSSTADELAAAEIRARGLAAKLAALGWPAPLMAMSGNGWHVQYRTALPNNPETSEQLRAIYAGLAAEFSDDEVQFDRAVRNPARLCALYGSVKRKGINHPERPHRQSVCQVPREWRQVHPRQVEGLANLYARQTRQEAPGAATSPARALGVVGQGDYRSLDAVAWFISHGAYVGPLAGNVHGVLCPWSGDHSTPSPRNGSDTVIFAIDGDGWPGFHCKHSHCAGRDIRDVLALWNDGDAFCAAAFAPMRRAG
ncbi:MAG: hypothetical protein KAX46_12045 [Chromatiaceae bacterium]|nr:hypothetical protein [Chromatiaceae bacterium]